MGMVKITQAELIREALEHPETTKISVIAPDGSQWLLCNDTALKCKLDIQEVSVEDGEDIITTFVVASVNGRII